VHANVPVRQAFGHGDMSSGCTAGFGCEGTSRGAFVNSENDGVVAHGREGLEAIIRKYLTTAAGSKVNAGKPVPPPPGLDLTTSVDGGKLHRESSTVASADAESRVSANAGANVSQLLSLRSLLVEKLDGLQEASATVACVSPCVPNQLQSDSLANVSFGMAPSLGGCRASDSRGVRDSSHDLCRAAIPVRLMVSEGSLIMA
jgi:hypothetical protein